MTYTTGSTMADSALIAFNARRIRTYLAGLDGEGMPKQIEWAIALETVAGEIRSELARGVKPQGRPVEQQVWGGKEGEELFIPAEQNGGAKVLREHSAE